MRVILKAVVMGGLLMSLSACHTLYFRGDNPGYNFELAEPGAGLKVPLKVDAVAVNSRYDIPSVPDARLSKVNIQPPDFNEAQQ